MVKTIKRQKSLNTKTKKNRSVSSNECELSLQFNSFEKIKGFGDKTKKRKLIKLLKMPFSPSKITPRSDFYSYVNYLWLKDTSKSIDTLAKSHKYFVQIDDFRVTQNRVYIELFEIVKEYIKKNTSKKAKMIKNVYTSLLHLDERPLKKHVAELTERIEYSVQQQDPNYIWTFLANINKNELVSFLCPIYWTVLTDEKDSSKYRNYISAPQLPLYDYNLYLEDYGQTKEYITYKKQVIREYKKYLNQVFEDLLGKNHGFDVQDILDISYELLLALGCNSTKLKNEEGNFYNVVKAEESLEKYGFDWISFCDALGYKKAPDYFICDNLNYLKCVCKLLNSKPIPNENGGWENKKWKTYWYYMYLRQMIRFSRKSVNVYYNFYGKFIQGQQEPFPIELYPIFGLSYTFNTFLTEEYVSKYKNEVAVRYVDILGRDLITVFKRIIGRNTWLSEKTKKYALLKLEHLKLLVAQPKVLREDPLLDYSADDAWGNMCLISAWKIEKYIKLEGNEVIDIPIVDWNDFKLVGQQAYIVNAFYTPTSNSIYIPLAYIQKPFVDLGERGIEYDLARIGFTLAHEMSHSLDDLGSKYDYKGNLHDWWTPEDKRKYKLIIKDIIHQYEKLASYDGIKFDASIGVGEDMADISGLSICTEYLADFQEKNQDIVPIKSLSFQAFFVYYAMQQRGHIYKEAIKAQLKTNPHPLEKYRTNAPLSRIMLFKSLYNVKKGDKMWWNNDTVW